MRHKISHKHNTEHNGSHKRHNTMCNRLNPNYVLNFYMSCGIVAVDMGHNQGVARFNLMVGTHFYNTTYPLL